MASSMRRTLTIIAPPGGAPDSLVRYLINNYDSDLNGTNIPEANHYSIIRSKH